MRFYTVEKLGNQQSLTPEGFLLCEDVAIARTGEMLYGPGETPIEPVDGAVRIARLPKEVFRPETIASFNGKPVVNEHPDEDVNPDNWRHLAVGVVMNARQGEGAQEDLMLADLQITDPDVIELVRQGKREISCGYDADYVETAPGRGEQTNILGNHVALVDSGRCGARCTIKDSKGDNMAIRKKNWKDRVRDLFKAKDEAGLENALKEVKDDEEPEAAEESDNRQRFTDEHLEKMFKAYDDKFKMHDDRHKMHDDRHGMHDDKLKTHDAEIEKINEKLSAMPGEEEKEVEKGEAEIEAPVGTGDDDMRKGAKDSAYLQETFQTVIATAEIIVPGVRVPTFDATSAASKTVDQLCGLRRKTLQLGVRDAVTAGMIEEVRNGRTLDEADLKKMPCQQVKDLFNAVGAMKRVVNNKVETVSSREFSTPAMSIAELNKRNAAHYKK